MKKFLSLLAVVFTLGLSTVAMDAEAAKRMGSGKSLGMQRQQATPDKSPGASPTQSAAAPAAAGAAGAAAAPKRSWMGPIAGLAAGLGLAALASHLGFGEELASMLMFGLLAAAIMVAVGFFLRKRAAGQQPMAARAGGMQYAPAGMPAGAAPAEPTYKTALQPAGGSMIGSAIGGGGAAPAASRIPADFDVAGFTRNAKVNFIRLQAASDTANLNDIREFTTPEMFAELRMELSERGTEAAHTEVVTLDADVMDVEEGVERYVVSVRFTGTIREEAGAQPEAFDEIWHLVKPRQGGSGWLLAGIQQMQ